MQRAFNPLVGSSVDDALRTALAMAEKQSDAIYTARRNFCLDYYHNRILAEDNGSDAYLKDFFQIVVNGKTGYPSYLGLEHVPLVKKIIRKKGRVYKTQPVRKLSGKPMEEYTKLLSLSGFGSTSKEVDRLTYLLDTTCVGIFPDVARKRLIFRIYNSFVPLFGRDDPFDPVAAIVETSLRGTKNEVVWAYYDDTEVRYVDKDGVPVKVEGLEDGPHNLGTMPLIFSHAEKPTEHFFGTPRVELAETNQAVDVAVSSLNQLMRYNGFKQFYIIGKTGPDVSEFVLGKSRALVLEGSTNAGEAQPAAGAIDLQGDFVQHIEAIKFSLQRAAWTANVNIKWSLDSGTPASGISLKIQDLDDLEDREDTIDVYKEYLEIPLFQKVQVYAGKNFIKTERGSVDDFTADFSELGYPETNAEVAEREKHEIEINVTNPIRLIMQRNPDLSEEDAAKQYLINKKVNKLSGGLTMESIMSALEPTDEEMKGLMSDNGNQNPGSNNEPEEPDETGQGIG